MQHEVPTSTLLYDLSNSAGFISCHDEDILKPVQDYLHHLGILHRQQVTEWRDDVLLHQKLHLHTTYWLQLHVFVIHSSIQHFIQSPREQFCLSVNGDKHLLLTYSNMYGFTIFKRSRTAVNIFEPMHQISTSLSKTKLTWSFLPLMVRLLMAHAASFWVPKSPCGETGCHQHAHIAGIFSSAMPGHTKKSRPCLPSANIWSCAASLEWIYIKPSNW